MGLTFTLTSFTCTSPFVGTILVSASQGDWQMPLVGMLAFSTVFALPFFVLALAPQYVSIAARRRLDEFHQSRDGFSGSRGGDEISFQRRFDLEMGNFHAPGRAGNLDCHRRHFSRFIFWVNFSLPHDSKPEKIGAFGSFRQLFQSGNQFLFLTGLFGARLGELESFLPPDLEKLRRVFSINQKMSLVWIKTI
jgi:hypothetical protein